MLATALARNLATLSTAGDPITPQGLVNLLTRWISPPPDPETPPDAPDAGRYLSSLRNRTAYIDIRGLQVGSGRASRFPINELYIPLTIAGASRVVPENDLSDSRAKGFGRESTGRNKLREALEHKRLVTEIEIRKRPCGEIVMATDSVKPTPY